MFPKFDDYESVKIDYAANGSTIEMSNQGSKVMDSSLFETFGFSVSTSTAEYLGNTVASATIEISS